MKFAIIDAANLFTRAHHVCSGDAFDKAGMALHIVFQSLRKIYQEHNIDHMVVAGEGRSWRYDYYPQYKAKRILARKMLTPKEQEEKQVYNDILTDLMDFFATKTRMTVLQANGCEGDDFIARWVQLHPNDEHIIVSADSDNLQLLAHNVIIYDGITERTISLDGVFDAKGKPMVFHVDTSSGKLKVKDTVENERKAHTKAAKEILREAKNAEKVAQKVYDDCVKKNGANSTHAELLMKSLGTAKIETLRAEGKLREEFDFKPEEDFHKKALFIKIIRGDVGDGIFSAAPNARYKGSKTKVGIEDAWNDRIEKGYNWNNFFLRTFEKLVESPEGDYMQEVRILDEFQKNERLIDLTLQPDEIKTLMDNVIIESVQKETVKMIGINFARFCAKHDLKKLGQDATDHAAYLSAPYGGQ